VVLAAPTILAISLLAACASDDGAGGSSEPAALRGPTWILDAASMRGLSEDAPTDSEITIAFEEQQASGRAACNSYFGGYEAGDDGSLRFDALGSTQMACEEPLMTLETAYLAALGEVEGYSIDGSTLELTGDGRAMTFDEVVPPEPLPLTGTAWRLTTIATGTDAVSSTIAGTEITMTIDEDGTVSGSAGCNSYTGTAIVEGDRVSFGPLATTKKACEPDVNAQEQAFLTAMGEVRTASIDGTQLELLDPSGSMLLAFDGA
jgi:heat shock protein HslJ